MQVVTLIWLVLGVLARQKNPSASKKSAPISCPGATRHVPSYIIQRPCSNKEKITFRFGDAISLEQLNIYTVFLRNRQKCGKSIRLICSNKWKYTKSQKDLPPSHLLGFIVHYLSTDKKKRSRHWRRIRSWHSTSECNQYIQGQSRAIFHFQVDLNV